MTNTEIAPSKSTGFALFSILLGAVGLFAAFELATEYIKTLKNSDYVPNCEVSVLVTCGPNMDSWQGSLFGFSNTILGLVALVAPIAVGVALLAGARFAAWFWWIYRAGLLLGVIFIFWLAYQSIFGLGTLCPWCMVVWTVMIPLFFGTAFRPEAKGYVPASPAVQRAFTSLNSWAWVLVLLAYILIAAVAQFQLNWFAEFGR
ncbi:vitamin K epoxide reductase family protein [Leucobacter denitrificans]|uniref:Vitamin K epoxide reductase family protein n=1 Tax=Leucobacter denitrificans TaxID=683042 RepID=A0A7G9S603_9MICO|nr:vitamin K epoxide reductase family protein [Leucobacter denitrificans]QNN63278.1 vitamin K epoxide reductase family protein [Leucobacter denitrificans]